MARLFLHHNGLCLVVFIILWAIGLTWVQTLSALQDMQRLGITVHWWEPFSWESTSIAAMVLLLYPLAAFSFRWPLNLTSWRPWAYHLLAFLPFSVLHIMIMIVLRQVWYTSMGSHYDFGDWWQEGLYEIRKDFMSYLKILAVMYMWQLALWRAKGEASVIPEVQEEQSGVQEESDRLLVKKLGREYLVNIADIHWIEASGNYVNLHFAESVYPMRATMAATERRLLDKGFCRVHRSIIVKLSQVESLKPKDNGDYSLLLRSGACLNVSRRYKESLKERLQNNDY